MIVMMKASGTAFPAPPARGNAPAPDPNAPADIQLAPRLRVVDRKSTEAEHRSPNRLLPRAFYDRPTLDVARDLIGKVLVHARRAVMTSGIIVEAEAYIGEADPACHAAPGPTARNAPLYGPPGHAYVYLNYGIHCLVNAVTEAEGSPAAVLIRALEPLDGLDVMRRRRTRAMKGRPLSVNRGLADRDLCRGPGNLTMAMGITLAENRLDLLGDRLFVEDRGVRVGRLTWGPRIGINVGTDRLWRVYVVGHAAVSVGGNAPPPRTRRIKPRPQR